MIEAMIGFAILGVGIYLLLTMLGFIDDNKAETTKRASMEIMISGLIESVRSNINMEKVDFNADAFLNKTTYEGVKSSLKQCWVKDGMIPLTSFPECPGRIGYVVAPMKTGKLETRGLYKVTIRLTHDELFPNQFKQYEFIVKDP